MKVYQVANWNGNFENNKSRGYDRCTFVCVPNKLDGMGLRWILKEPDGPAVYGMFHLILCRCSKQTKPREGWLTENGRRDGSPLTAEDLGAMFGRPVAEVQRALDVLSSPRIGWIACHQQADAGADSEKKESNTPRGCTNSALEVPVHCPDGALVVPSQCLRTELNGTEQKDGNGRLHSTHQVSTCTTATGVQAGASRPSLQGQAETNGNRPQEKTLATQKPAQTNATATNRPADGRTPPPAADRSLQPNAASGRAGPEVAKPCATTAHGAQVAKPDRADRPAEVQYAISRLGEILRRVGWHEVQVRRALAWLIGWKRGAWILTASEGDYWRVAAQAIGVQAQGKASGTVRDEVGLFISLMENTREPREEHYRTAKDQWLRMDDDPERVEPIYMREVYAEIGKHIPPPQPQRSAAEVKRRLLSFDGAAGA